MKLLTITLTALIAITLTGCQVIQAVPVSSEGKLIDIISTNCQSGDLEVELLTKTNQKQLSFSCGL